MYDICEFCKVVSKGGRDKRLPFGQKDGRGLVVLRIDADFSGQMKMDLLLKSYPQAYFVYRHACTGVDQEEARIGCGVLLRNILWRYKVVVMPESVVMEIYKETSVSNKDGQYIVKYTDNVLALETVREYERALKQC